MDLPSSAYQPAEQDLGLWSEALFPSLQTISNADQQSTGEALSFTGGFDFSAYHEGPGTSTFVDLEPSWGGRTIPSVHDVNESRLAQEEMCRYVHYSSLGPQVRQSQGSHNARLREENRHLKSQMDDSKRQISELEDQFDAFQQWTAKAACILNEIQMKQEGLSPLPNRLSHSSSPITKRKKVRGRASKVEVVKDERQGSGK